METFDVRSLQWSDLSGAARLLPYWQCVPRREILLGSFLHQFDETCLAIEDDGGLLRGVLISTPGVGGIDSAHIHLLAVDPEVMGTGVVELLLGKFSKIARERGCLFATIPVLPDSSSFLSLLKIVGFSPLPPPEELSSSRSDPSAVKKSPWSDPGYLWRDYLGADKHPLILSKDL